MLGLWDQVPNTTKLEEWEGNVDTLSEFYKGTSSRALPTCSSLSPFVFAVARCAGNERVKKVLTGFDAIHDHIHSVGQCTLALRDYFPWYTHRTAPHRTARTARPHARNC